MKYLSVTSGIEAATQAWHPLGWEPVAFSEIEPFPCKVLAHHYPNVPNLGDMTKFKEWPDAKIDVLVGGTPCQSFSVAGLRKGLDDPRGNLMLTYLAIADKYKPTWIVFENVPGLLSSNGGKDFGTFLGALEQLGYGFAYRVLDAQFVRTDGHPRAVPQRRRRVFVVGCLGDWGRAAAVLFDSESLRGNSPPSRKTGQAVAGTIGSRTTGGGGLGTDFELAGGLQAVAPTLRAGAANGGKGHGARSGDSKDELIIPVCMSTGQAGAEISVGFAPTLNCNHEQPIVFDEAQITSKTNMSRVELGLPCGTLNQKGRMTIALAGNTIGREPQNGGNHTGFDESGTSYTLTKTDVHAVAYDIMGTPATNVAKETGVHTPLRARVPGQFENSTVTVVRSHMQVRRLTPTECERLQAFPDGYTNIPGASDSARYKALGNSMAVNVMQLIGQRIQYVEDNI